jgi:hypothetical protein
MGTRGMIDVWHGVAGAFILAWMLTVALGDAARDILLLCALAAVLIAWILLRLAR